MPIPRVLSDSRDFGQESQLGKTKLQDIIKGNNQAITSLYDLLREKSLHDNMNVSKKTNFAKLLSQKFGEEVMDDGKLLSEDPNPEKTVLEAEFSDDDSLDMNCLKGERVVPMLRIRQVDKLLQ